MFQTHAGAQYGYVQYLHRFALEMEEEADGLAILYC